MGGENPSTSKDPTVDPHEATVFLDDVGRVSVSIPHDEYVSPTGTSDGTTAYIQVLEKRLDERDADIALLKLEMKRMKESLNQGPPPSSNSGGGQRPPQSLPRHYRGGHPTPLPKTA